LALLAHFDLQVLSTMAEAKDGKAKTTMEKLCDDLVEQSAELEVQWQILNGV
jgi:hypothetical protein